MIDHKTTATNSSPCPSDHFSPTDFGPPTVRSQSCPHCCHYVFYLRSWFNHLHTNGEIINAPPWKNNKKNNIRPTKRQSPSYLWKCIPHQTKLHFGSGIGVFDRILPPRCWRKYQPNRRFRLQTGSRGFPNSNYITRVPTNKIKDDATAGDWRKRH